MQWIILGPVISYLIGSIPTAYIFGRALKGIDIRKFGSGNVGATNALRVLGRGPGITVLVLDILKGFLVVFLLGNFVFSRFSLWPKEAVCFLLGLVCICGHNWTIFLNFKGGKGLAATLGVLLGLAIQISGLLFVLGLSILVWLTVFLSVRIVSVASVTSAIALPLLAVFFRQRGSIILFSCIFSTLIILRHKSNLKRLFQGKEPRFSFKKTQKP